MVGLNEIFNEYNKASKEELENVKNIIELYRFTIKNQSDKSLVREVYDKSLKNLNGSLQKIDDLDARFMISYTNLMNSNQTCQHTTNVQHWNVVNKVVNTIVNTVFE